MLSLNDLKSQKWFHSIDNDSFGRHIVYVHQMNSDIFSAIPEELDGKKVLVYYATSRDVKLDKYKNTISEPDNDSLYLDEINSAIKELFFVLPTDIVTHIFFEIHDGKNHVTNYGEKYPSVKNTVQKLYDKYGFDILFEQFELNSKKNFC